MMRAVLCTEFGNQDKLSIADIEERAPEPGEVAIDVKAASLNFPDLLVIQGLYQYRPEPPFVPGGEAAGLVSAVGEGVTSVFPGQRVTAVGLEGAFAERWIVEESSVVPMPDAMSFETAAVLTLAYGTSYHALKQRAELKPGETLLVLGAAGGVGSAAVEIGREIGAVVIAAASSDEKLAFCRELGADETVNYATENLKERTKELTKGRGADVIYDPVGGDLSEQAFRAIAWKGRHLVVGFASGQIPSIPSNLPLLKGASIIGVFWGSFTKHERPQHIANSVELLELVASGSIKPRITRVYSFEEYQQAFDLMASRSVRGKVVIQVS